MDAVSPVNHVAQAGSERHPSTTCPSTCRLSEGNLEGQGNDSSVGRHAEVGLLTVLLRLSFAIEEPKVYSNTTLSTPVPHQCYSSRNRLRLIGLLRQRWLSDSFQV